MRCERYLERRDALDRGQSSSAAMRRHLAGCPSCRARVEAETRALEAASSAAAALLPASPALLEARVMAAVALARAPRRELSLGQWGLAGGIIALSSLALPLGAEVDWIKENFGASYALPLSLVLGTVIVAYVSMFARSHLEWLGRLAGLVAPPIGKA